MKDEGYDEWLKELKVGDVVIVERSWISEERSVARVVKITPKGFVRISRIERLLFKNGFVHIRDESYSYRLLMPTRARIDEMRLLAIRYEIRSTNWHQIDDDVVKSIYKLLQQK